MIERTFEIPVGRAGGRPAPGEPSAPLFAVAVEHPDTAPDAELAILLHGGPGASHDYLRPQLDALGSPHRRLIYYDQRGGGRSNDPARWPGDWPAGGIDEHLRDLSHVIETVSDGRPPILIGYSWGGLLALHFALDEPGAIEKLLLIAPAPPNIGAREVMRERLAAAAERPDVKAFAASVASGGRGDPRQRFAAAVAGYFVDPKLALGVTPFMVRQRAERGVWSSLAGYDLRPRLPRLAVPTRIIHGIDDPIPVESARETARLSGAELVEIPRCGHVPYVEAPEAFLAAALPFLDGRDGG